MNNDLNDELAELCLTIVNEYLNDNNNIMLSVDQDDNDIWHLNFENMEQYEYDN